MSGLLSFSVGIGGASAASKNLDVRMTRKKECFIGSGGASPTLLAGWSFKPDARAPIAKPRPEEALIQVDVGVDDVGGVGGFGDWLSGLVVDGGAEIVAAGDEVNLVFDGPGFGEG